ncbi:MAG: fibronectin type III domain-containing protein, partial [Nitrosopumilus sp.]
MKLDMKGSYCYMFTLGLMILFGISVAFSYDLIFAQVEAPPDGPIDLEVNVISSTQLDLSWSLSDDNDSSITGFKIEARINTDPNYSVIVEDTGSIDTEYTHTDLTSDVSYVQYRVYAINSYGPSENYASEAVNISENSDSDQNNESGSDVPTNVKIKETSSNSVELTWDPPTKTYGQTIQSYTIKEELVSGEYVKHGTGGSGTKSTISDLNEDKTYVFAVVANYVEGTSSGDSKEVKITLNSSSSNDNDDDNNTSDPDDIPDRPDDLEANAVSSTKIDLSWEAPDDDDNNNAAVTGYKIEVQKEGDSSYETVVEDT